jgi:hypothetical protein
MFLLGSMELKQKSLLLPDIPAGHPASFSTLMGRRTSQQTRQAPVGLKLHVGAKISAASWPQIDSFLHNTFSLFCTIQAYLSQTAWAAFRSCKLFRAPPPTTGQGTSATLSMFLRGNETSLGASLKERLPHIRNFYLYVSETILQHLRITEA